MDEGLVDKTGYPIASLYHALRAEARARGINIFELKFRNNRALLLDLGVPPERIRTVVPQLICTRFQIEYQGIPSDYDKGINLPDVLH